VNSAPSTVCDHARRDPEDIVAVTEVVIDQSVVAFGVDADLAPALRRLDLRPAFAVRRTD